MGVKLKGLEAELQDSGRCAMAGAPSLMGSSKSGGECGKAAHGETAIATEAVAPPVMRQE